MNSNHCPNDILVDTTIKSAKDAEERGLTTGVYLANIVFSSFSLQDYLLRSLFHS